MGHTPSRSHVWLGALAAVCIGAVALVWYFLLAANARLDVERHARYEADRQVMADMLAENMIGQLRRLDDMLLLLRSEYVSDPKDLPRTVNLLRQGSLQSERIRVTLIDRAGYVAYTDAPLSPSQKVYLGDRPHFRHFAEGGEDRLYIDGPVMGRMTGKPGIQIARPIQDRSGHFAGVINFFIEPAEFTSFARNVNLGPEGTLTLYSSAGTLLGRSLDNDKQFGKQLSEDMFRPFRQSQRGVFTRISALDGVKRTVAFRWLDHYPLLVAVAASPQLLEEGIAEEQAANMSWGVLISCLIVLPGLALGYHLWRRDRLEWLLERERAHLLEAQRVAHLGSWERDLQRNRLWWSEEVYRILNYLPSQQTPSFEAFIARVHPDDRARVNEAYTLTREKGNALDLSCRLVTAPSVERFVRIGGRVLFDKNGRPRWLTGTMQDMTDYMRLQHALLDAEERWKFALEGTEQGVWDWYIAENRVYFSPRWKEIIGYRDEELHSRHEEWLERLHPEDKEQALHAITEHFAGRQPVYREEFRLRHRDGSYRWILSRGRVCARDEVGRPLRMLGTIVDISERKQAELALAKSEAMQRSLVSVLAEGVVVQGREGQILSANAAARRILHLSEEQLLARGSRDPAWNVIREDGQPFPADEHPAMVTLRTGVSSDNVIMGVDRPDGGRVWLSVNSRPLIQGGDEAPYAVVTSFADITAVKAAELSGRLYRDVLERAGRAILVTDPDGIIDNVNSAFVELMGFSREECVGQRTGFYRSNRHDKEFFRQMWQSLKNQGRWHGEVWNRRKTGEAILLDLDIRAVTDAEGHTRQYVGIYQDVTELRRNQEDMWRRAHHDPLTGLPNRALFHERFDQAINHARRQGDRLGLLYLDLDGFKAVNDTYGHQAGDALLQEVGRRMGNLVRACDTVARLAGDEFAVLLPHLSVEDDLSRVMEALSAAIAEPVAWQGKILQVGVSIGSAIFPDQAEEREGLIGVADQFMYLSKHDPKRQQGAVTAAAEVTEAPVVPLDSATVR